MLSLKLFLKVLPYIWPFMRAMFLGKKTWLEALKDNKKKIAFMFLCLFSFGLNFVFIPRSTHLAYAYVELDKRYNALSAKYDALAGSKRQPINNGQEVKSMVKEEPARASSPKEEPKPPKAKSVATDIQDAFTKIKQREDIEH